MVIESMPAILVAIRFQRFIQKEVASIATTMIAMTPVAAHPSHRSQPRATS
jgi:hypothetical protein